LKCLYLTNDKPSRKGAARLAAWLKENYPDCTFDEVNVTRVTNKETNGGRYQGRVSAPEGWFDDARAADRQAVLEAARRLLADGP
jgi:hypothetical protein